MSALPLISLVLANSVGVFRQAWVILDGDRREYISQEIVEGRNWVNIWLLHNGSWENMSFEGLTEESQRELTHQRVNSLRDGESIGTDPVA
jgi:hypothetical protein